MLMGVRVDRVISTVNYFFAVYHSCRWFLLTYLLVADANRSRFSRPRSSAFEYLDGGDSTRGEGLISGKVVELWPAIRRGFFGSIPARAEA